MRGPDRLLPLPCANSTSPLGLFRQAQTLPKCIATSLRPFPDGNRDAPSAKVSRPRIKPPCNGRPTIRAASIAGQPILLDLVPVAHDQRGLAAGAKCRIALLIVDVAGVDILQTFAHGDQTGAYQCAC